MPTREEHTEQAEHNGNFWRGFDLSSTEFLDWVVIGLFYEIVHWIEAFLDSHGDHSDNHPQRLAAMKRYSSEVGAIRTDYEILKQESENARYRCQRYTSDDISSDLVPVVEKIRNHIKGILT